MDKQTIFQQVKDFYNQNCQTFSSSRKFWWPELDFIRKYLKKKGSILDFGCGNGRLINFLDQEKSLLVYQGVDISQGLLTIAQKKYPQKKFLLIENNQNLPFAKESFDLVLAIAVFHHLSPSMAEKTLREIKRVLKKEGKIILTVWNLWKFKYLTIIAKDFFKTRSLFSGQIPFGSQKATRWCYWWTQKKLEKLLKKEGFEILESGITRSQNNEKRNYYLVGKK